MRAIETVGVIGLGNMGGGMARSLVRAGFRVLGFDLAQKSLERAQAGGVELAPGLITLAEAADAVITILPDSPDVEECFQGPAGILQHLRSGALCIECSTIEPAVTDRLARAVAGQGATLIDAALGRSPAQAESGELLFMVGADAATLEQARPLLNAMGDEIHHCGPTGAGIRMKLVINLLSQSTCQLSAEVMALGLKMGLEREHLLGVMGGGLGANGFITRYWPTKVLAGDTSPGFAIRLSAKDMRHAVAMAGEAGVNIPVGQAAATAINSAAKTHGNLDVSGLLVVACEEAGTNL